jgi:hypothetical protein
MKKLLITISFMLGFISTVSADIGVNIGISGNLSVFHAEATEREDETLMATAGTVVDKNKEDATAVAGYTSFFIEKTLGFLPGPLGRLSIGYDMVQGTLDSDTTTKERIDMTDASAIPTARSQNVKVEFADLNTLYATLRVTDNLYLKAGTMEVDVNTKETLATGSTYGNTSLTGDMFGVGYARAFGPGLFFRLEGTMMDFGGKTLTSETNAENSVTLNALDGASARLSIGKSF